jgi:hypothetical protein
MVNDTNSHLFQSHISRPHLTIPAQDLNIQFHLQDHLRPASQTADKTVGLQN